MENLAERQEKMTFLSSFRDLTKQYLDGLQAYHKKDAHSMPLHGRLAFEHGIAVYKATLKWCKTTILQLESV